MNLQGLSLQTFTMVAIVPTQIHNIHIQTEQLILIAYLFFNY